MNLVPMTYWHGQKNQNARVQNICAKKSEKKKKSAAVISHAFFVPELLGDNLLKYFSFLYSGTCVLLTEWLRLSLRVVVSMQSLAWLPLIIKKPIQGKVQESSTIRYLMMHGLSISLTWHSKHSC
ncbi:hypothetical protein ACJX0J_018817 [Zea mays]